MSFLLSLMFLFNKIGEEGRTGSAWKWGAWGAGGVGAVAQTMYVHMEVNVKTINERRKKKKKHQLFLCLESDGLWMGLHYQFSWLSGLQTWDGKITISFPASQPC
jgi:hypothetical protein